MDLLTENLLHREWLWDLHGELIDHGIEKMNESEDNYDHYRQALKLANRYYKVMYPPAIDSPTISK